MMRVRLALVLATIASGLFLVTAVHAENTMWHDPRCHVLSTPITGHMIDLADGSLLAVKGNTALISKDDGKTWNTQGVIYAGPPPGVPNNGLLIRTRDNAIVLVYMDMGTYKWGWNKATGEPIPGIRLDVWSIRSLDNGKTWLDRQKLQAGYCGALITIIQTRSGQIVVPVQNMVRDPGHNVTATYVSADDGKIWQHSNTIDLGGHGNHDGAFEATLVQLKDGRLWMLLRTPWDRFWSAFSKDNGLSWRRIEPSYIDASSSPGYLLRLASGRLVLVWNRLHAEGSSRVKRRDGPYSEHPASWQRDELSIAFSDDDGQTWTKPVVIARKENGNVSYPYVFERRPGALWIFAGGGLKVSLQEKDFVRR